MKKFFLLAIAAVGLMTANAQQALEATGIGSNWSIGLNGGAASPIKGHGFLKNARGVFGIHVDKQISPVFGLGLEAYAGVNTASWDMYGGKGPVSLGTGVVGNNGHNVIDNTYVGIYGTANLMNLFGGYKCDGRFFEIRTMAGAGWGRVYGIYTAPSLNSFETKAGLSFDFNVSKHFTVSLQPSIVYNMSGFHKYNGDSKSWVGYDARLATANLQVAATYHFGDKGFKCVKPYNADEVAALNAEINNLRAQLDGCVADLAASAAATAALAKELEACKNRPAPAPKTTVVEKVNNNLETVRYVYFANASSTVTSDQMRTVDIIASYMKSHPESKLDIKGYASANGNLEFNKKLAAARAESVKKALVSKYKINADRINAQGEGVGSMFEEESWNRVAICTLGK